MLQLMTILIFNFLLATTGQPHLLFSPFPPFNVAGRFSKKRKLGISGNGYEKVLPTPEPQKTDISDKFIFLLV
jgi:hypothetical protein